MHGSLLDDASEMLGCKVEKLPLKYLGLPLSNRRLKVADWDFLIQCIQRRLSLWQGPLLSLVGRLVLIKATISSLPIYHMSLLVMPSKVI